jgi:hypothetical protein
VNDPRNPQASALADACERQFSESNLRSAEFLRPRSISIRLRRSTAARRHFTRRQLSRSESPGRYERSDSNSASDDSRIGITWWCT